MNSTIKKIVKKIQPFKKIDHRKLSFKNTPLKSNTTLSLSNHIFTNQHPIYSLFLSTK